MPRRPRKRKLRIVYLTYPNEDTHCYSCKQKLKRGEHVLNEDVEVRRNDLYIWRRKRIQHMECFWRESKLMPLPDLGLRRDR